MTNQTLSEDLIQAADRGDLAAVEQLLARGADVHHKDASGRTALMAATQKNHIPLAQKLIEAGSDVNARDITMLSPYLCAGANGFHEILSLTLAAGADTTSVNRFGGTTLLPSSEKGYLRTVQKCSSRRCS